jgi:hypothetical protein
VIKVDKEVAYKVEIDLLKRQLAEKEAKKASAKKVEGVCNFCLKDYPPTGNVCQETAPRRPSSWVTRRMIHSLEGTIQDGRTT